MAISLHVTNLPMAMMDAYRRADRFLSAIETYRKPLDIAEQEAHAFESAILSNHQDAAHWNVFFRTLAQLTVIKRLFWHTRDAVQKLELSSKPILSLRQDLRERIDSLQFFCRHVA